jgi:UDPglucose--hexose-1-phosphate uridylyltransferase
MKDQMELRKDPITRSWVIVGDEEERNFHPGSHCPFCPGSPHAPQVITALPSENGAGPVQAMVHPSPLYRVEGDPHRRSEGIYDVMNSVGAHEVLVQNMRHDTELWQSSDAEILQFLHLAAHRIQDLKQDLRFKYVTVYKNQGAAAGQQFDHPTSQLTATTFVPRRVLYELRASRDYYLEKERCVFCDTLNQEMRGTVRMIEMRGDYVVFCPYASRVPYEMWIMPRRHEAAFERTLASKNANLHELAGVLRRTLQRVNSVAESFHLVLHTVPNTYQKSNILQYWKTVDEDYHWHIEVLPVIGRQAKPYFLKEVYYSPISSEVAAERLRALAVK